MKILFVTDLYPIKNEKIAKALFYFVYEWKKQGHTVEVIRANFIINTLIRGRKIIKEKIYYENGIKIYNLNFHTPFLFNVYNKLPNEFSLQNYDILISHMPSGALMADKLLKKCKIKYICAVHASDIVVLTNFKYSIYFKNKLKSIYKKADKIAARSPVLKSKAEALLPFAKNKIFTAYSGIDNLTDVPITKNFAKDTLQIITAASLIKRKNIDLIIKTIPLLKSKDIKLTIIGSGKERNHLEKLSKSLKLNDKIAFLGELPRNEVIENLKKSDIFILISSNETFGLSYLEAMAAGNIIIAKKNDGIDGILSNGKNAFLIEPRVCELKNCIEKILSMSTKEINQIKQQSYNTVKNFKQDDMAKEYLNNSLK